jgi:drug/metabolite transporter (DMT)-like permease
VRAIALPLVIAGAIIHALWNILAKQGTGGPLFVWAYSGVSSGLYLPLALCAVITSAGQLTWLGILAVVMSGALHAGYSLSLQGGYGRADLSVVYPVARGTGPALSVFGAILLLGEPVNYAIAAGAALVVIGIFVIGIVGRPLEGPIWRGVCWGALTGIFIASYTINDGAAVRLLSVSPIIIDYFGNIVRVLMLTPVALRRRLEIPEHWRKSYKVILGVGLLIPIPYILALYAMTLASVSVIATARELSMMVGVVFGRWLLEEPKVGVRLGGAALIAAAMLSVIF